MAKTLAQRVQNHGDGIKRFIGAADDWRRKQNPGWELFCVLHAVQHCLSIAVSAYDSPEAGVGYLNAECRTAIFDRVFALLRELHIAKRGSLEGTPPE